MQTTTTRLETFSDGVMAIVITVMILELKLPDFQTNRNEYTIEKHLLDILPHLVAYIFSFSMIGIIWIGHHQLFHLLKRTDNFLMGLNLFFLFWISLIPYVTANIGANPSLSVSSALYGFIMLMTCLSLLWIRHYTLKKDMGHTDQEVTVKRTIFSLLLKGKQRTIISCLVYLISIPVAFVNVYASYICFMIPIIVFLFPTGKTESKLEDKVIDKNR